MNKLISYTLVVFFATLGFAVAAAENDPVMLREQTAWQAYKDKKEADFRALAAENYRGIYPEGIMTLGDEMKSMQQMTLKSFTLSDLKLVSPNPDTQVVTYKVNFQFSMGGKDGGGDYNTCSIWQKMNEQWKVVLHTNIPVEKP
jgi:hypothetical protein